MCSLVFLKLNGNTFVLRLRQEVEMLEVPNMIKLPDMPLFLRGIINHKKKHVPIIDLSAKLNMPRLEFTVNTCLILSSENVHGREFCAGLLADAILEVQSISEDNLEIEKGVPFNDYTIDLLIEEGGNKYLIYNLQDIINEDELVEIETSISEASI